MSSLTDLPKHPAKYSASLMPVIVGMLDVQFLNKEGPFTVWDPFGGVGGIHEARQFRPQFLTFASELEFKWVVQAGDLDPAVQADALSLPLRDASVDAVVTSPCYGNRMADHHEAKDACGKCEGWGCRESKTGAGVICYYRSEYWDIRDGSVGYKGHSDLCGPCKNCGGSGLSKRNTYRHQYGEPLRPESAAIMQWGTEYRNFHYEAWQEVARVVRPGGALILNCSDHIRKGEIQHVTEWHVDTIVDLGFKSIRWERVDTRRNRMGKNGEARVEFEDVVHFERRPA